MNRVSLFVVLIPVDAAVLTLLIVVTCHVRGISLPGTRGWRVACRTVTTPHASWVARGVP
jgi:hypothetical protein